MKFSRVAHLIPGILVIAFAAGCTHTMEVKATLPVDSVSVPYLAVVEKSCGSKKTREVVLCLVDFFIEKCKADFRNELPIFSGTTLWEHRELVGLLLTYPWLETARAGELKNVPWVMCDFRSWRNQDPANKTD